MITQKNYTEGLTYDKSGHYRVTAEIAKDNGDASWQDDSGQWWLSDEAGDKILLARGAMTLEGYVGYHGLVDPGQDMPDMYIVKDTTSIYSDPSGRGTTVEDDGTIVVDCGVVFEDYYSALRDGDLGDPA